ncbi:hypothetical protein D3C75_1001070 [compost metagenome]
MNGRIQYFLNALHAFRGVILVVDSQEVDRYSCGFAQPQFARRVYGMIVRKSIMNPKEYSTWLILNGTEALYIYISKVLFRRLQRFGS